MIYDIARGKYLVVAGEENAKETVVWQRSERTKRAANINVSCTLSEPFSKVWCYGLESIQKSQTSCSVFFEPSTPWTLSCLVSSSGTSNLNFEFRSLCNPFVCSVPTYSAKWSGIQRSSSARTSLGWEGRQARDSGKNEGFDKPGKGGNILSKSMWCDEVFVPRVGIELERMRGQ